MNIGKMNAQEMIVWGLAVYGGYNLIKSQTDFLSAAGPSSSLGFKGRIRNMRCKVLNSRKGGIMDKYQQLISDGTNPNWQNALKYKIQLIDRELRNKGC